jgi:hypothetical protein
MEEKFDEGFAANRESIAVAAEVTQLCKELIEKLREKTSRGR